jgi:hypothetical protein
VGELPTPKGRLEAAAAAVETSREALKAAALAIKDEIKGRSKRSVAEQRLRWIVPVTQPIMLCSQIQRSGGTLLARLFDGHPSCFAHPNELRWGRPEKWHWPAIDRPPDGAPDDLLAQLDERWPRQFAAKGYHKYSEWTHRHHPDQVRHYPFVFDGELQRRVFAEVLERQPGRSQRDCLNAYLSSLFNAWLDYQNLYRQPKQWVTAFVPKLAMMPDGPDRFFADYPDGLLVTIVREPAGWLSSFSRHVDAAEGHAALELWMDSSRASARAHAARPDRVVVLLFEDLVHRTEAVMRLLCARMGLAYDEVLLEPTFNSMPVLSDSSHVLATGVDAQVTERHRQALSPEQADGVARTATPHYEELRQRFGLTANDLTTPA